MIPQRNSWRSVMMLVCLPENYDHVAEYAERRIMPRPTNSRSRAKSLGEAVLRATSAALAVSPMFTLSSYPLELDILLRLICSRSPWRPSGWQLASDGVAVLAVMVTLTDVSELTYLT
jgi:hypothetical protein